MSADLPPTTEPAVVAQGGGNMLSEGGPQPEVGSQTIPLPPPVQTPYPIRRRRSPYPFFAVFLVAGILLGWGSPLVVNSLTSSDSTSLVAPTPVYPVDDPIIFTSSVTLVWKPVREAAWYYVQIYSIGDGSNLLNSLYVSSPSYAIEDLSDGAYGWTVRAEVKDAYGDWSEMSFFTIRTSLEEPVPVYPVAYATVNSTAVDFQWTASPGADRYEFQVSSTSRFDTLSLEQYTDEPSYVWSSHPSDGTTYFWRVKAFEVGISSEWSEVAAFVFAPMNVTTVSEPIHVTWNWTFPDDGSSWSYSFNVSVSEYDECMALVRNDQTPADYSKYVTEDSPEIVGIADYIASGAHAANMTDYETVWLALSFVHATTYVSDLESIGYDDYARYPVETLVDGVGDCEDTAALFTSIVRAMGYDAVMLYIYDILGASSNHMGAVVGGISMPQGSYSIQYGGESYYYCETTPDNWTPGQLPQALYGASYVVVP
jgi:hypothetical protein